MPVRFVFMHYASYITPLDLQQGLKYHPFKNLYVGKNMLQESIWQASLHICLGFSLNSISFSFPMPWLIKFDMLCFQSRCRSCLYRSSPGGPTWRSHWPTTWPKCWPLRSGSDHCRPMVSVWSIRLSWECFFNSFTTRGNFSRLAGGSPQVTSGDFEDVNRLGKEGWFFCLFVFLHSHFVMVQRNFLLRVVQKIVFKKMELGSAVPR